MMKHLKKVTVATTISFLLLFTTATETGKIFPFPVITANEEDSEQADIRPMADEEKLENDKTKK